jgi:hypothetical protein
MRSVKKFNDIATLEAFLPNILNSEIDEEEYEKLKPDTLLRLLEILQLSLQYFDYTQDYLDNLAGETSNEIVRLEKKILDDEKKLKKSKKEI